MAGFNLTWEMKTHAVLLARAANQSLVESELLESDQMNGWRNLCLITAYIKVLTMAKPWIKRVVVCVHSFLSDPRVAGWEFSRSYYLLSCGHVVVSIWISELLCLGRHREKERPLPQNNKNFIKAAIVDVMTNSNEKNLIRTASEDKDIRKYTYLTFFAHYFRYIISGIKFN